MAFSVSFSEDKKAKLRLSEQLRLLGMSRVQSRRFLARMGKKVQEQTKKNIREQKTIDGSAMDSRLSLEWNKKKMFRRMSKGMRTWVNSETQANVTWKKNAQAKVAFAHQHGIAAKVEPKARRTGRRKKKKQLDGMASKRQAKALVRQGFRRRVARKGGKGGALLRKVSTHWIQKNISAKQAGAILRAMGWEPQKSVKFWEEAPKARPFLGVKEKDAQKYMVELARETLAETKKV